MDIWLHNEKWHAINSQMRRFALPFLIALILHGLVLSQLGMHTNHSELKQPPPLTVRLMLEQESPIRQLKRSSRSASKEAGSVLTSSPSDVRLDMNQIRNQARSYARDALADNEPALSIEGDYYGSFSGDDSGVFYVHLYANGHASGTGQSNSISIPFLISGDVDKEGVIAMQGSGIAGDARFTGQLNIATGTVSGSWNVPGFMKGSFSAHREELRSAKARF